MRDESGTDAVPNLDVSASQPPAQSGAGQNSPGTTPPFEREPNAPQDSLSSSVGILVAAGLGLVLWIVIIALVVWLR